MVLHKYKQLPLRSLVDTLLAGPSCGNLDMGWGRLFGGQLCAQSLSAALVKAPSGALAHSIHCTFLREGSVDETPRYEVEVLREGRSFSTIKVRGLQRHGIVCETIVSTHVGEEGLDHQVCMPDELDPVRDLGPNIARYTKFKESSDGGTIPPVLKDIYMDECQPIIMRPISFASDCIETHTKTEESVESRHWIKLNGSLDSSGMELSKEQVSQICLAFLTDFRFLSTSLLPHGVTLWQGTIQPASLSHSLYFHRPFVLDDWVLFNKKTPNASMARGFVNGEIFERNSGKLLASAVQEGLIRPRTLKRNTAKSFFS